jgi:hypothetical protein
MLRRGRARRSRAYWVLRVLFSSARVRIRDSCSRWSEVLVRQNSAGEER